ncbi:MAG: PHP domain-containing protein [Arenibacterium sp.]
MKIVLHAHSVWSYDGVWELDQIARFYGRFGADVVMMSEHDTGFDPSRFAEYRAACEAASTPKCRLIPGIEYSSPDNDIHILTWGLDHFLAEHRPVAETLEQVRDKNGVAIFAHPVRRKAWQVFDPAWVPLLSGIEVWNRKSDGITIGGHALDLVRETGLPATVGQDFHRLRHAYPLTMRATCENADNLEAALVEDLRQGRMAPFAFGRPLFQTDGTPATALHDKAETLRRGMRDVRNALRGNRRVSKN